MRVLIVDDREENRFLLQTLLLGNGYEAETAVNGVEALEKLETGDFELIISDILMPVMDGFRLCREVKKDKNLCRIPFIFYTATYTGPQDEAFARKIGANQFIVKPCEPNTLIKKIQDATITADSENVDLKPGPIQEEEMLKLYNERLVRKLEQKMLQLEKEIQAKRETEEELRRTNSFLDSIVENIPDMIFLKDAEKLRFVRFNKAGEELLGLSREELIGKNDYDFFPKEEADFFTAKDRETLSCKEVTDIPEEPILTKYRGQRILRTKKIPILDVKGNPKYLLGISEDITERKLAERVQRETEDRLSQTIMGSPVPTFVIDNNHIVTHWNKALENVTGISGRDVIGTNKHWIALYSAERPVMADLLVDSATKDEVLKYYNGKLHKSANGEHAYAAEDFFPNMGSQGRWLFFTAAPLRNSEGEITGAVETLQDITARKKFEQSLQENEERYRSLFESSSDSIFIMRESLFYDCNPKTLEMFDCTREQIIGESPYRFSPEFQPDGIYSCDKALGLINKAYGGQPQFFLWQYCRYDGSIFDAEVSLAKFDFGGAPHLLAIVRDITERIESEKRIKSMEERLFQSQKMEAIGTMAGGIAHDFNNILGGIFGYVQLAQLSLQDNPKAKHYIEQLYIASDRAKGIVQQILAFSRQSKPEKVPTDIGLITKEALKLLRASIPTTIEIEQSVQNHMGAVEADPNQIHQIVLNLCTNAFHAMRSEGGKISVDLARREIVSGDGSYPNIEPGMYLKLSVTDSGHGMDAVTMSRIFEPYFTTKDKGEGTGMGLAVVHGIVTDHGGDIKVYSELGVGSTFEIFLPIIKEEAFPKSAEPSSVLDTGDETILLVDDEEVLVEIGKDMLEQLGYRVVTHTSSYAALKDFKARPDDYDLVITDMTMPEMTGDRLAREINKIRSNIPIILCTGFSEKISPEDAKQLGIHKYLMKPVTMGELANTVRSTIDRVESK